MSRWCVLLSSTKTAHCDLIYTSGLYLNTNQSQFELNLAGFNLIRSHAVVLIAGWLRTNLFDVRLFSLVPHFQQQFLDEAGVSNYFC